MFGPKPQSRYGAQKEWECISRARSFLLMVYIPELENPIGLSGLSYTLLVLWILSYVSCMYSMYYDPSKKKSQKFPLPYPQIFIGKLFPAVSHLWEPQATSLFPLARRSSGFGWVPWRRRAFWSAVPRCCSPVMARSCSWSSNLWKPLETTIFRFFDWAMASKAISYMYNYQRAIVLNS